MTELQERIEHFQYFYSRYYSPKGRFEFVDEFQGLLRSVVDRCQMITKEDLLGINPEVDLVRECLADDIAHEFAWLEKR